MPHKWTAEERYGRISEVAHHKAEQREVAPGGELNDWLDAEREVDGDAAEDNRLRKD